MQRGSGLGLLVHLVIAVPGGIRLLVHLDLEKKLAAGSPNISELLHIILREFLKI